MQNENAKHLKKIIEELRKDDMGPSDLYNEADEFIEALDDEIIRLKDELDNVEGERDELKKETDGCNDLKSEDFILDTFRWRLDNGNLKIQTQVEEFVLKMKKHHGATIS